MVGRIYHILDHMLALSKMRYFSIAYYFSSICTSFLLSAYDQGDFNCGASPQADSILNNFLSKFLEFPLTFFISSQPGWQAGTIKVTLPMTKT